MSRLSSTVTFSGSFNDGFRAMLPLRVGVAPFGLAYAVRGDRGSAVTATATILLMVLVTYLPRLAGFMLSGRWVPPFWLRFLRFVPISVFAVLIVPDPRQFRHPPLLDLSAPPTLTTKTGRERWW